MSVLPAQASANIAACRRNSGRSSAPVQQVTAIPGNGSSSTGLSACASSSSSRRSAFIECSRRGRRSCTPEIEITRSIRLATLGASGLSRHAMRVTRCPPAECPASRIGPATRPAADSSAEAI